MQYEAVSRISQPSCLLPANTVHTVFEGHQEPLAHRKLQVFCLCDDQHVWARQGRAYVVQVDLAVIRHQTNANFRQANAVLPT